jgi:hypothetical protein
MRLADDIRNLTGRKILHRDRVLKTACHEACQCVIRGTRRHPVS